MMVITGSLETMKEVWQNRVNHDHPIIYTITPQGNVRAAYPITGQFYEWELDPQPTEAEFLAAYWFAHRVKAVRV
jgi:hypothetical protein